MKEVFCKMNKQLESITKQLNEMALLVEKLTIEVQELKNENALLKEENEYLKKKLFGTKSEKAKALGIEQFSFFDEAEQECDPALLEEISYKRAKKKKKNLDVKLGDLPCIEEVLCLPDDDKACPRCGNELNSVGKEFVRREVQYIPAKLIVKKIYRMTYECRNCKKGGNIMMVKTGIPAPVIPHSYASAESVAHVMKEKFVNGVPLYRQEQEFKRLGLELSRATMANWVIIASNEWLKPIVNRMHEELLKEHYTHADETTIQVLREPDKKSTTKSYMWVYASIKESKKPIRIFDYKPTRAGYNPAQFLKGFQGAVITDAYAGYNNLEGVTNVYCWAHARRKFSDSMPKDMKNTNGTLAQEGLKKIAALFKIEKEIEDLNIDEKIMMRQEKAKALVDDFFSWCEKHKDEVLSKSKIHTAFQYALNHKKGLSEYLNDGYLPMTNSLDERTIRMFTIGRKNWLFSTSVKGAESSAAAYSIIETAKANGLDPYLYLSTIFRYLPSQDLVKEPESIDKFLPWSNLMQEMCKN